MSTPRCQHTVLVPLELEQAWKAKRELQPTPESFNAFIVRLMKQELASEHVSA